MTDADVARILANVRVPEILDLLAYPWELAGDRTQQIRCPIHDDRSPSARYYHDQQKVHCFTCGKSWDVIGLVAAKRGLSREMAVRVIDEEFPTAATAETITQRIRAQLREPTGPQFGELFENTERRLIARRRELGLVAFSKRVTALDIIRYQHAAGDVSNDALPAMLARVLA